MKQNSIKMKNRKEISVEEVVNQSPTFVCPCCETRLTFRIQSKITSVGIPLDAKEFSELTGQTFAISKADQSRTKRIEENKGLLQSAHESGIMTAFNKVLELHPSTPTDPDSYFIKWLGELQKQNAPQFALRQVLDDAGIDAKGDLSLWGWQNTSVIISDGEFRLFLPRKLVNGGKIETLEISNGNQMRQQTVMDLDMWIRTKYGYVQHSKAFSQELKKHSVGGFQLK